MKIEKTVLKYLMNLLILLDLAANTILAGSPYETISSRLGKAAQHGNRLTYFACRVLHWFDKEHCLGAINENVGDRAIWRWR